MKCSAVWRFGKDPAASQLNAYHTISLGTESCSPETLGLMIPTATFPKNAEFEQSQEYQAILYSYERLKHLCLVLLYNGCHIQHFLDLKEFKIKTATHV